MTWNWKDLGYKKELSGHKTRWYKSWDSPEWEHHASECSFNDSNNRLAQCARQTLIAQLGAKSWHHLTWSYSKLDLATSGVMQSYSHLGGPVQSQIGLTCWLVAFRSSCGHTSWHFSHWGGCATLFLFSLKIWVGTFYTDLMPHNFIFTHHTASKGIPHGKNASKIWVHLSPNSVAPAPPSPSLMEFLSSLNFHDNEKKI